MSREPALMTLTEVARAIAMKQVSSHEVTRALLHRIAQWQPHLNAFMSVEAEIRVEGCRGRRCRARQGQCPRSAARRAARAQGHVLRRRPRLDLRLADPPRFRADRHVHRLAAAEGCRPGPPRHAASGRIRLWPDRPQRPLRPGAQSLERRAHHRRLVLRLRLVGRGAPDVRGARLRHRRFDPHARAFLRRHRA